MPSISNLANRSVDYGVQVFSYEELEEATDHFSRELGDGGFSTVYYGKNQTTYEIKASKLTFFLKNFYTKTLKAY